MHCILWEFEVPAQNREAFKAANRPNGDWAELFRKGNGYKGTELLEGERFITIDRWEREADFEAFKATFGTEYDSLDCQLEGLSSSETRIGGYKSCA